MGYIPKFYSFACPEVLKYCLNTLKHLREKMEIAVHGRYLRDNEIKQLFFKRAFGQGDNVLFVKILCLYFSRNL